MATRIKLRRGTTIQWSTSNPVLGLGEFGYETNTARFKIGDGVTAWNSLDYNEQTISLTGDASGSGFGVINVTVHDDSHNHTTATLPNFTEDVQDVVGAMLSGNTEDGLDVVYDDETGKLNFNVDDFDISISGDASGTATVTNLTNTDIAITLTPEEINFPDGRVNSETVTMTQNNTFSVIGYLDKAVHTTSEHLVQMKQGSKTTSAKVIMTWDGTDAHITQYGVVDGSAGRANVLLDASDNASFVNLVAISPDAATTNVEIKAIATYVDA
jgi:hypothetical protein